MMDTIRIRRIAFGSYIKLCFISGVSIGVIFGLLFLLIGLLGGPVNAHIGTVYYTGMIAGVIGAVLSPILSGFIFAWFGVVTYLPLTLVLKILKGLRIRVQIVDIDEQQE